MTDQDILIVGTGMVTAVGLSAAETTGSVRCGTARFVDLEWRNERFESFKAAQVPDDGLHEIAIDASLEVQPTYREMRLLRLGVGALTQCVEPMVAKRQHAGLWLALPDRETLRPLNRAMLLKNLVSESNGAIDQARSAICGSGRSGGLTALAGAVNAIRQQKVPMALAGGIDSFLDLYLLGVLNQETRILTRSAVDGFVPGEGAGFVLLSTRANATAMRMKPLAQLVAVSEGFEAGHMYSTEPYKGDGLAATFQLLFEQNGQQAPVRSVYSAMNGENHWAREWGVAYMRNKAKFDPTHVMYHPADCWGETGAASGPLMIGLAAIGLSAGYRRGPALVYCSSDSGPRAATLLAAA